MAGKNGLVFIACVCALTWALSPASGTGEGLFIGIACEEPNPDSVQADMADGDSLWQEDSVEVFLSPDDKRELQFVVNAIGSRAGSVPLSGWQAEAYIDDASWSVEIAVPWQVIGALPETNEAWGLNVCRNIVSSMGLEHSTWAHVRAGFHEPANFGRMLFETIAPELREQIEPPAHTGVAVGELLVFSRPRAGVLLKTRASEDRVLYNQGAHIAPRISPGGKRILFNSLEGGTMGVWLVDRGGRRKERICDGTQAAWSPDGLKVLFQRDGRLIERDLATGKETAMTPHVSHRLAFPSYCPDGGVLCTDEAGEHVFLVSRDQPGRLRPLVDGEILSAPRCSPDGKMLAYQDGPHLYVMDLGTGRTRQLTLAPGVQTDPVWAADSRGICYAQADEVFAEEWTICHVKIASPQTVRQIERNVYRRFDWHGAFPPAADTETFAGTRLTVYKMTEPFDFATARKGTERSGWQPLPESRPPGPLDGAIAVENDWLVLSLSKEGVLLVPKKEGVLQNPIEFTLTDEQGRDPGRVSTVHLAERNQDRVVLKVFFGPENASGVILRVTRVRPIIAVRPERETARVSLKAHLRFAVMPDRFASDLILDPGRLPPAGTVALPQTPVVLGCLAEPHALLMVVMPSDAQSVTTVSAADQAHFDEIVVAPMGNSVFVSALVGDGLWDQPKLTEDSDTGQWRAKWKKPFHGLWRMTACGADKACSRMWTEDDLSGLGDEPLPIEEPFAETPESVLVYVHGRDRDTPPSVLTPTDILPDVLGVRGYAEALDIEGVRGYRSADGWVPFRELATRDLHWTPWGAHGEERGFGVLETMCGVYRVGTDGTRSFVRHMGNDAVNLLRGLDQRIDEYERFLSELKTFCREHRKRDGDGLLASVGEQAQRALQSGRDVPRTDIGKVVEALEDVLGLLDPEQRRHWRDSIIGQTDEFREFSRRCRAALAERQSILSEYRALVKRVRERAAHVTTANPGFKDTGDQLRALTQRILRNRYYLEGDWRGETPLRDGGPQ